MAVKIRLKRLGKVRVPQYRIVVVDSRKKRDGKVIEEIGKYHPKEDPSYISVVSDRAQYWLGVGAQPSDAVAKLLKITGDWQTYKGYQGTEGTLRTAEAKPVKLDVFNKALADAHGSDSGEAVTKKAAAKKAAPKEEAPKREAPKEEAPPKPRRGPQGRGPRRGGPRRRGHRGSGRGGARRRRSPLRSRPTRPPRVPQLPPTRPRQPRSPTPTQPTPRTDDGAPTVLADALEHLVRGVVDHPDDVVVRDKQLRRGSILEVRVHPDDLGKVIGRGGRTATAFRTVISALAGRGGARIDFVDVDRRR